jgi:peptide/nickel transport system permease protein
MTGGRSDDRAIPTTGRLPAPIGRTAGRSPGSLAWARLRADRTAVVTGWILIALIIVAAAAPLVEALYGIGPQDQFQGQLDRYGMPIGPLGGISTQHWLGLEPGLGRDIFIRLVYGLRTSLVIATIATLVTITVGAAVGLLTGLVGRWTDGIVGAIIDVALAMPFLIVALTVVPTLTQRFYGPRDAVPPSFQAFSLILVFAVLGWAGTARLVRGQVLTLRDREFVDAARAGGAGTTHIICRELLPNLTAPILVSASLALPAYIAAEAGLSFLGIGILEPTPDFGRMIQRSLGYLQTDPVYVLIPGSVLFLVVLAFNLFGDAVREALDPRAGGSGAR